MSQHREQPLDEEWLRIGLARPARDALVEARLYRVSDMRKVRLQDVAALHGMGKSALARLRQIMDAKKIRFRDE